MSVYNKIKIIENKLVRESITHRFKESNFWDYSERKSFSYNPVFRHAYSYFDNISYKHRGKDFSLVLKKVKKYSYYKHNRIFKRIVDDIIVRLYTNSLYRLQYKLQNNILIYTGQDRSSLSPKRVPRVDDGIRNWVYHYEDKTEIHRIDGIYYFKIRVILNRFYKGQLYPFTSSKLVELTIKDLRKYNFYKEDI